MPPSHESRRLSAEWRRVTRACISGHEPRALDEILDRVSARRDCPLVGNVRVRVKNSLAYMRREGLIYHTGEGWLRK